MHSNNHASCNDTRLEVIGHYHQLQHSYKGIKIASLNVNRIRGHHDELRYLLANTGHHITALNETNVDKDVPDQLIEMDGYKLERKDRTSIWGWVGSHLSERPHQLYCWKECY